MTYLKCNNCGHRNEVKTEYLTFCSNCNKKLENNYPDWKRMNSDKSFEDFKQIVCEDVTIQSSPIPKSSKIKGLKYWIGFFVAFSIFYAFGHIGGEKLAGFFKKPVFDKALVEIANEVNKTCPIMVDQITRLDNSLALPENVFQYNYTLLNTKDSINIDGLKSYLESRIINDVKTNPGMKYIRDNHVTVNYNYKDMTGINLFLISVKPEQYE